MKQQEENLMTRKTLSIKLQVTQRAIANWEKIGLPTMFIGDLPRYDLEEVIEWMKTNAKEVLAKRKT